MTGTSRGVLVAHPGAELYGSDRMLLESVSGLVEAGHEVTVVLPATGDLVAALRGRGCRVEFCPMPVLRKSALSPRGLIGLVVEFVRGAGRALRLIRRYGSGAVYVSTLTIPSWLVLARLLGKPTVCHVHEAERSARLALRRATALPVLCAGRVIVNSEYSLDVLAEAIPRLRARSTVIYNGVPGPTTVVAPRPELTHPVRLVFVGRLSPRKGPDVALDALEDLVAAGTDARLSLLGAVFPGYEWFERTLRARAAGTELAGRVDFLGFEADVWPRLEVADIVLVPSVVDEPFGNTSVEALLAGRPSVVSATSGLREAAEGYATAVLVAPGDRHALADAVTAIASAWPEYAAATRADAARARERHNPARYRSEVAAAVAAASRQSTEL